MKNRSLTSHICNVFTANKMSLPPRADKSVAIFDIDNTLLHPSDGDLGSDQWFDALFQIISPYKNYSEVYHQLVQLILDLYFHVQLHIRVKPVEEAMIIYFNILQALHVRVILVTARGVNLAERTVEQLKDIGLEFNPGSRKKKYVPLGKGNKDQPPVYQDGIIYCSGNNKGRCLRTWLQSLKVQPTLYYVIDDKLQNVFDILEALKDLKHSFLKGYRYGYLDDHVKQFNLEVTNEQIIFLASQDQKIAELYNQFKQVLYNSSNSLNSWQSTLFFANVKAPETSLKILDKDEQPELRK